MKKAIGVIIFIVGGVVAIDGSKFNYFLPSSSLITDIAWLFIGVVVAGVGWTLFTSSSNSVSN